MNDEPKFDLDDASDRVELYSDRRRLVFGLFVLIMAFIGSVATICAVGDRIGKLVVFPYVIAGFSALGATIVAYLLLFRPAEITIDSRRICGFGYSLTWDEIAAFEVSERPLMRAIIIVPHDAEASLRRQTWWFRKVQELNRGTEFERLTFLLPISASSISEAELLRLLRRHTDKPIVQPTFEKLGRSGAEAPE